MNAAEAAAIMFIGVLLVTALPGALHLLITHLKDRK